MRTKYNQPNEATPPTRHSPLASAERLDGLSVGFACQAQRLAPVAELVRCLIGMKPASGAKRAKAKASFRRSSGSFALPACSAFTLMELLVVIAGGRVEPQCL
jgi:hypothetical protein